MQNFLVNPIRFWEKGGGALKAPALPIFCPHAFTFEATLLCVVDFSRVGVKYS